MVFLSRFGSTSSSPGLEAEWLDLAASIGEAYNRRGKQIRGQEGQTAGQGQEKEVPKDSGGQAKGKGRAKGKHRAKGKRKAKEEAQSQDQGAGNFEEAEAKGEEEAGKGGGEEESTGGEESSTEAEMEAEI